MFYSKVTVKHILLQDEAIQQITQSQWRIQEFIKGVFNNPHKVQKLFCMPPLPCASHHNVINVENMTNVDRMG